MISLFNKICKLPKNPNTAAPSAGMKIGLWKWDIKKDRFYINDFWLEILGSKKNKVNTIENWLSYVHPDDKDKTRAILADYIKSEHNEGLELQYRLRRHNGEYIWLFLNGQMTKCRKGRPVQIDGIIIDITKQKQTENELYTKNSEVEALFEESEAQNEEMTSIMDELQSNQVELEDSNSRLRISETKFRNIFENSPIGIIQSTLSGSILDANNALITMFGYESLEELIRTLQNSKQLYRDKDVRENVLEKLSKTDIVHALNITGTKKDKSEIYTNIYMLKLSNEFTGEKYLTTFVEDITKLKSSQFERDLFFNNSGDLLSITDFAGELKQINTAWTSHLGWDLDEIRNMSIYSLLHPDDIKKTKEFREQLQHTDSVLTLNNRYRTKNNDYRIIRWTSIAFKNIDLVFSSGRDETERYAAELELKEMWDRLDIALKIGVIGLWDLDISTNTLRINSNMADLLGFKSTNIKNASHEWKAHIHKDDFPSSMTAMKKLLTRESDIYIDEYRAILPDGKYRWFFSRGKIVGFDPNGHPTRVAGSVMDITEKKEAEAEKVELELKMQQAQKLESLGILAGGIAHDFNNLLTGILGNSDMLLYELPPDKGIQQKLLEIKRATKLASELTNQMLAYSGRGSFIIEHIDLNDLIIEMDSLLEASISKKVQLSYTLAPGLQGIKGDATQIRQIVMNLVLNGSEAIENNGTIEVTTSAVTLTLKETEIHSVNFNVTPGDYILLQIRDSGCGMESEKLKHIFDPFFTTKFTGRGLGLAAVSGIIRSHNAGLIVESTPGEGTCFKIYLPVSHEPYKPVEEIKKKEPSFTNKNLTILIADDEKYLRDLTMKMLNISGYKVLLASNGKEAIEVFIREREEIACILMDLTMPELDGREALIEIRKIDPSIPIIITSGYCEYDIASKFANEKISGFLQKPYNLENIITAIDKAVS